MEKLTNVTGAICIFIIAMGIIGKIGSFTATEKILRFLISVSILIAISESFQKTSFEFDVIIPEFSNYHNSETTVLKNEIISKTQQELEHIIKNRLDAKNISYKSVSVHILEQNDSITVDKIIIDCSKNNNTTVREILQDIINEDTVIITGE